MSSASRVEALVLARVHGAARPLKLRDVTAPLARYAPTTMHEAAWCAQLEEAIARLRERGDLDEELHARRGALDAAIGRCSAKAWDQLAKRTLPALGLGVAVDDGKTLARFDGETWWSAIAARRLGLWTDGPPPKLSALRDAFVWHQAGAPGKPKRCPDELAAHFLGREIGSSDGAAFARQVRRCAAIAVGAPRQDLGLVKIALVRLWCAGAPLGAGSFAGEVREVTGAMRDGGFGERKVFISAAWDELRRRPAHAALSLDDFKARLVAAHRAGELALARADLVAAMDPALVAASETSADGASFHFILREAP